MNEEEKTITANEPAAENQTKPSKPKRTDEEKLQECYERRDRLREQKTAHKNKGQVWLSNKYSEIQYKCYSYKDVENR